MKLIRHIPAILFVLLILWSVIEAESYADVENGNTPVDITWLHVKANIAQISLASISNQPIGDDFWQQFPEKQYWPDNNPYCFGPDHGEVHCTAAGSSSWRGPIVAHMDFPATCVNPDAIVFVGSTLPGEASEFEADLSGCPDDVCHSVTEPI